MTVQLSAQATEQLLQGQREVLAQLARGASLRETLSSIAHYAEVCTPDMQASILWFEASTGKLRRGGHSRLPDSFADAVDGMFPGPKVGSCGTAAFHRERVVSFDVRTDPLWEAFREFAAAHGIRSAWSTPLISPTDGSLLGVFGMYYPDTREPSPQDLELVDHFTHLAAIAIERSRRDEALRHSEQRRHQGLLALTAGLAHELNTPLGVARTASHLLGESLAAASAGAASAADALALVQGNVERSLELVRMFQTSVLEQGELQRQELELFDAVTQAVQHLQPSLQAARVRVSLERLRGEQVHLLASPVRLSQVFTNLIANVLSHAYHGDGGPLEITVGKALLHEGMAELVFRDEGRGMGDEEAARCTDAFFTTARGAGGTGLGLFIARHVIEAELGGSMLLETRPGAGVRWTLLIPHARVVGAH